MASLTIARLLTPMLLFAGAQCLDAQRPAAATHWVATWAASQQQPRPGRGGQPPASFTNQTVRMIAHTSIGGSRVRIQLSNAFGSTPLAIGAAHIALRTKDSEIAPGSDRPLAFGGKPGIRIPPGAEVVSDPVDLAVPAMSDLAVSIYVPGETGPASVHSVGLHTTYISKEGDFTAEPLFTEPTTTQSFYWLSAIDVSAPAGAGAIVTFGDSITDGVNSTRDKDLSWPSILAQRLQARKAAIPLGVANQGISGNRILTDGAGVNALARFDRDVISTAGATWVTVLEGINDIGITQGKVTPEELIAGMRQMIERAHLHGIKVIGCTITPYEGASYFTEAGETVRQAVNQWIRTGGAFDAIVDFDAATRDKDNPKRLAPAFNNTDHLHPNDAGYQAMADAFDLAIFTSR